MAILNPSIADYRENQRRGLDYDDFRSSRDILRSTSYYIRLLHHVPVTDDMVDYIADGIVTTAEHRLNEDGEEKLYFKVSKGACVVDNQPLFFDEDFEFEIDIPDDVTTYYMYIKYRYVDQMPPNVGMFQVTLAPQESTEYFLLAYITVDPNEINSGDNESGIVVDNSPRDISYANSHELLGDLSGGVHNQLVYQSDTDETSFIDPPVNTGYLRYNNEDDRFEWLDEGHGGLINVDMVDGMHADQFLRSDVSATYTGALLTIDNDFEVSGNAVIQGDLTVNGTTTTVNSTNIEVTDALLGLQSGLDSAISNVNDIGFIMERGASGDNATFIYKEATDTFVFGYTTNIASDTGDITITARGTLDADLLGNAISADKWSTARSITLSGDISGTVSIDGTADVTMTTDIVVGISNMTDVDTTGAADGDLLQFNASTGNWEPTDAIDGGTF